jgi:uncharacterized protein YkwD
MYFLHRFVAPVALGALAVATSLAADKPERPRFSLSEEEQAILKQVNEARAREGLPRLVANPALFDAARNHSANMALEGKLAHVLDRKGPPDRARAAGYRGQVVENIAAGPQLAPEGAFEAWMKSPGHRANVLKKEAQEIGLGIVEDAKGQIYYTQVFGWVPRRR